MLLLLLVHVVAIPAAAEVLSEEDRSLQVARGDIEERLELIEARLAAIREDDELSIVEMVTNTVVRFVGSRLLPRSDSQCKWHYAKAVCVPKCECEFRFKPGDLTLSRMCRRRRSTSNAIDDCDRNLGAEPGLLVKVGRGFRTGAVATLDFLDQAAPEADPTCDWSWIHFRCSPGCVLAYRFGDFHIGRSCRRIAPPPDVTADVAAAAPQRRPPSRRYYEDEQDEARPPWAGQGDDDDHMAEVDAFFETNWGGPRETASNAQQGGHYKYVIDDSDDRSRQPKHVGSNYYR